MSPRLQAVFYRASDGSEPVDDFTELLGDPAKQAAIDNQIDRLNLLTQSRPHLPSRTARRSGASCESFAATTARSCTGSSTAARGI